MGVIAMDLFKQPELPPDTETHRTCGECRISKPLTEFYHDGKNSDGTAKYRRDCKECYNIKRKQNALIKKRKKQDEDRKLQARARGRRKR